MLLFFFSLLMIYKMLRRRRIAVVYEMISYTRQSVYGCCRAIAARVRTSDVAVFAARALADADVGLFVAVCHAAMIRCR